MSINEQDKPEGLKPAISKVRPPQVLVPVVIPVEVSKVNPPDVSQSVLVESKISPPVLSSLPEVTTGDLLTTFAWNNMVKEINLKTNRAGDTFSGALTVTDKFTVKNADGAGVNVLVANSATGVVTVDKLTVNKTVDITSKLTATSATINGDTTITGKLTATTIDGGTAKSVTINGDTKINGKLTATTIDGGTGDLTANSATFSGKLTAESATINGDTTITGNLTLTAKIINGVAGSSSLTAPNATITTLTAGSATFSGFIQVDGKQSQNYNNYGYITLENNKCKTGEEWKPTLQDYSIKAKYRIGASEFNAYSDARIKQKLRISNSKEDLATLMQLKVTDYTMIDTVSHGNRQSKKLIAQEVATVYPNAVSYTKGFIPNIYQMAQIKNGFVTLLHPDLAMGDKVRLIFQDQQMEVRVTERDENGFSVLADKPESKLPDGAVFVFGKEVDDFHTVDYDAITMLNTSATQALATQHAALQARLEALETVLKTLKVESV